MQVSTATFPQRRNIVSILILVIIFFTSFNSAGLHSVRAESIGGGEKKGVTVELSTRNNRVFFDATTDVVVDVTISNPNAYAIKILKWFTPIEEVEEPLFTVWRDGELVDYIGRLYRRPSPAEQDYITLAAGESVRSEINLADYYDLSVSGTYEIVYNVSSIYLYAGMDLSKNY